MAELAVLMSVFNEDERFIDESVQSILNQTYKDFEMVVVCDKPERDQEVKTFLMHYNDNRIKYYCNEKNKGLAMSMNVAASLTDANYLARMDADDIAVLDRFEKQMPYLRSGQYDLIFSCYSYINEYSQPLNKTEFDFYPEDKLVKTIALNPNIVHHPTVIYTREIFEKVGGYRDFPCSQDADLWLRMQEAGCRFIMLPDQLIKYRVNTQSVTSTRWLKQQLTIHYILQLSVERANNNGSDSFSVDHYNEYLKKNGVGNKKIENSLRKSEHQLVLAMKMKQKGERLRPSILRLWVFMTSPILRRYYLITREKKAVLSNSNSTN